MNRSTFYKYYGSQYDLLQEIEDEILNTLEHEIAQSEDYNMHFTEMHNFIYENQKTIRILLNEQSGTNLYAKLIQLPAAIQLTEMALQNSKFSKTGQPYVMKGITACGFQIILHWLNTGCKETPQEIAEIAQKIMENMIE